MLNVFLSLLKWKNGINVLNSSLHVLIYLQNKASICYPSYLLLILNLENYAVASTLLTFVGLFRKAHEENLKQIEAERKKAQKEAEKEASQDRTPVKSKDGNVGSPRSPFKWYLSWNLDTVISFSSADDLCQPCRSSGGSTVARCMTSLGTSHAHKTR